LFGLAALAVDIGYMAVAKSELQNAADAGARAGALRLYVQGTGPNWNTAKQRAEEIAEMNQTTGNPVVLLSSPGAGYWNAITGGQAIQSPTGFTPTIYDFPAVKVTASRTGAGDGGPITTLFARTLNIDSAPMSASAIAVVSGPGYVDQRNLFPFVMSQCMYDNYWNPSATPPGPVLENGQPKIFSIGAKEGDPFCLTNTGVWTSLKEFNPKGANYIRDLVAAFGTNDPILASIPVAIGDDILLPAGDPASAYRAVADCLSKTNTCQFVTVAVVSDAENANSANRPRTTEVTAFSCLELLGADQGKKTIRVRMTRSCDPPGSGGIGPDYGFKPRPRIVQ
jgi:Flp pilus assembly protein TadG